MTNIRRRLLATPPPTDSLPSGYTKLEYLSGAGGYIKTDIKLSESDIVYIDFRVTSFIGETSNDYDNNVWQRAAIFTDSEPSKQYISNWGLYFRKNISSNRFVFICNDAKEYDYPFKTSQQKVFYNNFFINSNDVVLSEESSGPLYFMYYKRDDYDNDTSIYDSAASKMRLYQFSVLDIDGNNTYNLLPCTDSAGNNGLYDTVNKKFYSYTIV